MIRKILAGNWKMNTIPSEGKKLAKAINDFAEENKLDFPVILFPPATHISQVGELIAGSRNLKMGAQNAYSEESGAYTGEISIPMLKELEVEYLLVGHSERREIFKESDSMLLAKTKKALELGLKVVFCFGEDLKVREDEAYKDFVEHQLEQVIFHLSTEEMKSIVLAYEPIWAIGTGENASAEQAQEVHAYVRSLLADKFDAETAENTTILYGGSCKPANAEQIFAQEDVDGGLIGGASLKADDFTQLYLQLKEA